MPDSKGGEAGHGPVHCVRSQFSAQLAVVAVCRHSPDHVGWVDVFERGVHLLLLEVADDFGFEEDPDVLNASVSTGSFMFPDWSRYAPLVSFCKSLTPDPAPSATTITKCRFAFSCS